MRKLLFILGLLCVTRPANATITMTQHLSNIACADTSPCAVAGFSAVAAGSLIIGQSISDVAATVVASAGASGGGTWIVPSGCTTNADCHVSDTSRSTAVQYILSSTGSPTTLSCTTTLAVIRECEIAVYTFTGSSMAFDVGAVRTAVSGANLAGVSAGTLTGTNDLIWQGGAFATTATGCPNTSISPNDFPNGNASCGLINTTNNAAGNYTNTAGTAGLFSIAFKEAAASTTSPKRSLLGVGT